MEHTASKGETQDLSEKMDALKKDFADLARMAKERAVDGTTQWVKEHNMATVGIAAGVGFVVGLLLGRIRD